MRSDLIVFCICLTLVLSGCSTTNSQNPLEPGNQNQDLDQVRMQTDLEVNTNRYIWGLWEVRIGDDHQSVDVIPLRAVAMHLNCVRLLEVAPCTDCLTISNVELLPDNELTADLTLRHPYPGILNYTGFDVRGIFISQADYILLGSGRWITWGAGYPRMLNPDGYTALFNPTEFPETSPPALGYIHGLKATGDNLLANLNPFVAYAEDEPRRMFEAGSVKTRTVHLHVPDGPLEFGYAVDACWQLVDEVVTDPVSDFPSDANCLEAYRIDVHVGTGLEPGGGSALIHVDVFDHQGLETISTVTIEAPDLFSGEIELDFSEVTGDESYLFTGTITNEIGMPYGEYPVLVRVVDTETDQNLGAVDAWYIHRLRVKWGWAHTWGGPSLDGGNGVAVDHSGDIYVTGYFKGNVDFDPNPGTDEHGSNGSSDAYLSKFHPNGELVWTRTWGGTDDDISHCVTANSDSSVYVTGRFRETVDFDPGAGIDEHTSNGSDDVFLSKFDSNGEFLWTRTWGGDDIYGDIGLAVADHLSGDVFVLGLFSGTVDFDPGQEIDEHTANSYRDVYLSKFNSSGEFQWVLTWHGDCEEWSIGYEVAVSNVADYDIYVAGSYLGTVDFDPGPGIDERTSNGDRDVYLSKYTSSGDYQWVRTWGGSEDDIGRGVALCDSGNVYITGHFMDTVDFDPGTGIINHTSNGYCDIFMSELNSSGELQSVWVWGGEGTDEALDVAVTGAGEIYVTGRFEDTLDFDPGSGTEELTSKKWWDVFLSKFNSDGNYQWARVWGGNSWDGGIGVAADESGHVYVVGYFQDTVDFDPGPWVEEHKTNGITDVFLSKFMSNGDW